VGEIDLYYELVGDGPPVVLIPGLGADVATFEPIIHGLAPRCRVLVFDPRGAGRSDKPDIPYSIGMLADDTAGLMETVGQPASTVVGVSMGGRVALELALRHPERVERLVLVSTAARSAPYRRSRLPWVVVDTLRHRPKPPGDDLPPSHQRQLAASRSYDGSARLGDVHVPALILHGRGDRVIPYSLGREMFEGLAGSQLVTVQGGHLVFMVRRRRQLLDAIVSFVD
jgi:pimeloyl-ACP methyl ester carboxylesterase